MGLTISLKPGEDFYVGDEQFVVMEVYSETHFRVRRTSTGEVFEITPDQKTNPFGEVYLFGAKRRSPPRVDVVIDAARDTRIRRGKHLPGANPPTAGTK